MDHAYNDDNQEASPTQQTLDGLHAHWDCSQGVACSSLFWACLDVREKNVKSGTISNISANSGSVIEHIQIWFARVAKDYNMPLPRIDCHNNSPPCIRWMPGNEKEVEMEVPQLSWELAQAFFLDTNLPQVVRQRAHQTLEYIAHAYQQIGINNEKILLEDGFNCLLYVVGIFLCLQDLPIISISCSPLPCQGVPVEVLSLLVDMPTDTTPATTNGATDNKLSVETVAILKTLLNSYSSSPVQQQPAMTLKAFGIGSLVDGEMATPAKPSGSVRLLLGTPIETNELREQVQAQFTSTKATSSDSTPPTAPASPSSSWNTDFMIHMEANLDDMTGEALAFAIELLLKHGAADAWTTPIVMKKGRPAHTLHCLCRQQDDTTSNNCKETWRHLLELMFKHTTTLGVRIHRHLERIALPRSMVTIQTPYTNSSRKGLVNVKLGYLSDQIVSAKAEFDHCREISLETGIPIHQIASLAVQEALKNQPHPRNR